MAKFAQGWYDLKNPSKYIGDASQIRYMSSWELVFHQFLDNNPNIIKWSSENVPIPYIKPTDGRVHKYFPDYYVEYKNKDGVVIKEIVELKPYDQVNFKPNNRRKNNAYGQITYEINCAKWLAAKQFCEKNGLIFRIVTEKTLFNNGKK